MHSTPRRIAFVFDDGPIPGLAENALALLATLRLPVTFAVVGEKVAAAPSLARAALQAGHELVNHSYTHPHFKTLDTAAARSEIAKTQSAVFNASGHTAHWFWPPYLECDERIESIASAVGAERFPMSRFHLINTQDWDRTTDAATIRRLATEDTPLDSVILCHEWREETWAELPAIVAELRARGSEFLTFSGLAAGFSRDEILPPV